MRGGVRLTSIWVEELERACRKRATHKKPTHEHRAADEAKSLRDPTAAPPPTDGKDKNNLAGWVGGRWVGVAHLRARTAAAPCRRARARSSCGRPHCTTPISAKEGSEKVNGRQWRPKKAVKGGSLKVDLPEGKKRTALSARGSGRHGRSGGGGDCSHVQRRAVAHAPCPPWRRIPPWWPANLPRTAALGRMRGTSGWASAGLWPGQCRAIRDGVVLAPGCESSRSLGDGEWFRSTGQR